MFSLIVNIDFTEYLWKTGLTGLKTGGTEVVSTGKHIIYLYDIM